MSGFPIYKVKNKKYNIEKFTEDDTDDQQFSSELAEDLQDLTEEIVEEELDQEKMEEEIVEEQEVDEAEMNADEDQNDLEAAEEDELVAEESEAMEDEQDAEDAAEDASEEAQEEAIEDQEEAEEVQFEEEQEAEEAEEIPEETVEETDDASEEEPELEQIVEEEEISIDTKDDDGKDGGDDDDTITLETDTISTEIDIGEDKPDESDDDGLNSDDLKQINSNANPIPEESDESDDDIYIRPVPVPPPKGQSLGDVDEQLSDLTLADDNDSDNLLDQTGAAGQRARALADKMTALGGGESSNALDFGGEGGGGGSGIAGLIMKIPLEIIKRVMNIFFDMIATIFDKPINLLDGYLSPIRDALYRLYLLLKEIITLLDQLVMFPLNLLYMYYEIFRSIFALFGFPTALPRFNDGFGLLQPFDVDTCKVVMGTNIDKNSTCDPNDTNKEKMVIGPLMIIFTAIANMNIFRLADLYFNKSFRAGVLASIKVFFDMTFVGFRYILIAVRVIEKLVLFAIDLVGQLISLVENVVTLDNISEFTIVLIYCVIIIGSFVGINQLLQLYNYFKDTISSSTIGTFIGLQSQQKSNIPSVIPQAAEDNVIGDLVSRGDLKGMALGNIEADNNPGTIKALAKVLKSNLGSIRELENKIKKIEAINNIK